MFENIITKAEKNGLTAKTLLFQSGYYYDGKDNGYIYPVVIFTNDRDMSGKDLSTWLYNVEQITKRYKLVKKDSHILPGHYAMMYTAQEHIEKARYAYGKAVCFQEGFFMARYNNKNATEEELIKAGHDSLVRHGYTV